MFFKQLRDIAKPQWFELIKALKCSLGMSVGELAEAMGMSYMGVKAHCVELEKRGYLDTWRRPQDIGRPEKAYRLTAKANGLFLQVGADFGLALLGAISASGGEAAAEKMLFHYFHEFGERYNAKVKGGTPEQRAKSFARVRDGEGYLSKFEAGDKEHGPAVVEFHRPMDALAEHYPSIDRMEAAMVAGVVGAPVDREEERASGLCRVVFRLGL